MNTHYRERSYGLRRITRNVFTMRFISVDDGNQ